LDYGLIRNFKYFRSPLPAKVAPFSQAELESASDRHRIPGARAVDLRSTISKMT
jgi:hypothetical protein